MKYISRDSDRLGQAFKRIEELEKENIKLQKETALLRIAKPRQSTTPRSSVSPKLNDIPRYAQPTASSRNREKLKPQEPEKTEDEKRRAITIDKKLYVYKDGVPVLPDGEQCCWSLAPRYMKPTGSSRKRNMELWDERIERKQRASTQPSWHSPPPSPKQYFGRWSSSDDTPPEEPLVFPPSPPLTPTPSERGETEKTLENDSLALRSRLHDRFRMKVCIRTDSKTNLDYLRRAAEIVQKSIYDVRKKGELGWCRGRTVADGPHLMRLGRNEMMDWLGEFSSRDLAYNGYRPSTIHFRLLDVVPLRNAICHPEGYHLRDTDLVDDHLRSAHIACVILGDEEGSMEIRQIRDSLRDDANRAYQRIKDLYILSQQPFPGVFEVEHHHERLFKWVMNEWDRMSEKEREDYEEVFGVAVAWNSQRERRYWELDC